MGRLLRVLLALVLVWAWGTSGIGAPKVTDAFEIIPFSNLTEPTNDPDTGANNGFGAQFRDAINYWNLYNGAFAAGPPDPTANIDVSSSVSGSNFMPHYRFVQSSNSAITAKQVRDATNPSGSNFRFTFASGAAGDEAYGEETVQISGDPRGGFPHHLSAQGVAGSSNTGTFTAWIALQYLTVDGTITGMPAEQTTSTTVAAGASFTLDLDATTSSIAPKSAAQMRVRYGVRRGGAGTTTTGTIDFRALRPSRSVSKAVYSPAGTYTWNKPAGATNVRAILIAGAGGGGSGRRDVAGTNRRGGGGGGGGGYTDLTLIASSVTDTVTVTVGAGGTGGAAQSSTADGVAGNDGTASTFGGYAQATQGFGGGPGQAAANGGGGQGGFGSVNGPNGENASLTGVFVSIVGNNMTSGGGGAGGTTSGDVLEPGDSGGYTNVDPNGAASAAFPGSGSTAGAVGYLPSSDTYGGGGGGGGGGSAGATGRKGGAGVRGGGGGGGAGSAGSSASGAGGTGGDGYVVVIAW